jgi:hypothetical protein
MTFRVADIEEIKSLDTKYPDVNGSFPRLLEVIDYTSPNQ